MSSAAPVHNIPYPLAADDRTRDAVQTIVSGRKSWKTLKGKGEAVWPPYLEAALVEALDRYRPETSRSTRSLSRFPNRNRFISDYIYHVTGKRRTAKQVGSRLQQLRDTHGGKRILKLLSSQDHADDSGRGSLLSPPPQGFKPSRALVTIDVLPADASFPSPPSTSYSAYSRSSSAILTPPLSPMSPISSLPSLATSLAPHPVPAVPGAPSTVTSFYSPFPRPLRAIDPTVTFTSAAYVHASSSCSVYFNGNCVHRETTPMNVSAAQDSQGFVYRVHLVPSFWSKLCDSTDPGRYSIVQEIMQSPATSPPPTPMPGPSLPLSASVLLTVVYQLREPSTGPGSAEGSPATSPSLSPVPTPSADYGYPLSSICDPAYFQHDLPISPVSATFSDGPQQTTAASAAYAPNVPVSIGGGEAVNVTNAFTAPPPATAAPQMSASQPLYDLDAAQWYGSGGGLM